MSVICQAKNQVYLVQTKYIDRCQVSLCQEILEEGDLVLEKIHTKKNPTDMLTKVAPRAKFNHCKNYSTSFQLLEFGGARVDELRVA